MGNEKIFKALGSKTRLKMLRILIEKEGHLSYLARKVGISIPVASKHIRVLEDAGLVKRRVIGNVHLLSANINGLNRTLDCFVKEENVRIRRGDSLFDALKQLPSIEIQQVGKDSYIASIDGEEGYYIYEVDGSFPKMPINRYKPERKVTVHLKKIVSVNKKKVDVDVLD